MGINGSDITLFYKPVIHSKSSEIIRFALIISILLTTVRSTAQDVGTEYHNREIYSYDPTGKVDKFDLPNSEDVKIIVEFKGEPLSLTIQNKSELSRETTKLRSLFSRFEQDLTNIIAALPQHVSSRSSGSKINYEYYKLFYGVSLDIPSAALSELKKLDYIKKIHFDAIAKASLDVSVPLIKADQVWDKYGTKGEGVKVGVYDTGIDYTHPALGEGFGPGFKVAGGFDFINNDSDPMDDFGHGTHVAGIIAAETDSISGVAPGVELYAFKVLDNNGQAPTSVVIFGFEQSLDPNGDGDFSDRMDVANFSLGAPGTPNDALATAVDNASRLGMVVCAAAGNRGNFYSIESPGTAHSAITVGASDDNDQPASFSSKGPNTLDFAIKPDIVAPGVDIYSSLPNGMMGNRSGTSMATPHIAGVAALLKAIHPDWNSTRIKAAILNSAIDIGSETMIQGSGRVDALQAADLRMLAESGNISFGQIDLSQQIWTRTDSLLVFNLSDSIRNVAISVSGLIPGVNLSASTDNFVLAADDSQTIIFTLMVDNEIIGFPQNESQTFDGIINFASSNETIRVPWAFVKSSALIIETNVDYPYFEISNYANGGNVVRTIRDAVKLDPFIYQVILPVDTYDLFIDISKSDEAINYIFKENLEVNGIITVHATDTASVYSINLDGKDESGNLIASGGQLNRLVHVAFPPKITNNEIGELGVTLGYHFTGLQPVPPVRTSGVSGRFILNASDLDESFASESKVRFYNYGGIAGIHADTTLTNQPDELLRFPLKINMPVNQSTRRLFFNNIMQLRFSIGVLAQQPSGLVFDVNDDYWLGNLYIFDRQQNLANSALGDTLTLHTSIQAGKGPFPIGDLFFEQSYFSFSGDSVGLFSGFVPKTAVTAFLDPGKETTLGSGLVHANAFFFNNSGTISLSVANHLPGQLLSSETGFAYFGPVGDFRPQFLQYVNYKIFQEPSNTLVTSGFLNDFSDLTISPDIYRMEFTTDENFVEGIRSQVTVRVHFDLRKQDRNPPKVTSLKLLNDQGQYVGGLDFKNVGKLIFSTGDFETTLIGGHVNFSYKRINSAELFYKKQTDTDWISLPLTEIYEDSTIGTMYSADFLDTDLATETTVDLKLLIIDDDGNSTEQKLDPAFVIGNVVTEFAENEVKEELPIRFELYKNYPNPFNPETIIRFDISKLTDVRLEIFNVLGQKIKTLINERKKPGNYRTRWNGTDNSEKIVSSGIYIYRLKAGDFVANRKMILIK
jgi:subtilisin family serine protease